MRKIIFTIMGHQRLKVQGEGRPKGPFGIVGRFKYHIRLIAAKNADPARKGANRIWYPGVGKRPVTFKRFRELYPDLFNKNFLLSLFKEKLEEFGIPQQSVRSDATLLEEMHIGLSLEYFLSEGSLHEIDNIKYQVWENLVVRWLQQRFEGKLVMIIVHLDEKNPHIIAFVAPIVQKMVKKPGPKKLGVAKPEKLKNVLCAYEMFSGNYKAKKFKFKYRGGCSRNHSDYHRYLKANGLDVQRGKDGSKIKHRVLRAHEIEHDRDLPPLTNIELPLPKLGQTANEYLKVNHIFERVQRVNKDLITFHRKAHDREVAKKSANENKMNFVETREELDKIFFENISLRDANDQLETKTKDLERELRTKKTEMEPSLVFMRKITELILINRLRGQIEKEDSRGVLYRLPTRDLVWTQDFEIFTVFNIAGIEAKKNVACAGNIEVVCTLNGIDTATALVWLRKVLPELEMETIVRKFLKSAHHPPEIDLAIEQFENRQRLRLKDDKKSGLS